MRLFLFLVLLIPIKAQTATGVITVAPRSLSVVMTSSSGTILNCTITCNPQRTIVTSNCVGIPSQTLDVSQAGESVTYSLNLSGNALIGQFTQSSPVGTLTYSIVANGSTPASGNF